ncbi:nonstructural protein 4 [Bovine rotavirus C]|uniref:Nonstructural protein 4 n=1 Tax=Bovine rotavirus C TaxID=31588 RepID=A0A060NHB9_9REOV|nr:nonstructural protein 4 [Bovine rotavirus C]
MEFINQTFFSENNESKMDVIPYVLGIVLALTNGNRVLKIINFIITLFKKMVITINVAISKWKRENNDVKHGTRDIHKEVEEVMTQIREMRIHLTALFNSIHDDNTKWRMSESIRREKKNEMRAHASVNTSKQQLSNTSGLEMEVCL